MGIATMLKHYKSFQAILVFSVNFIRIDYCDEWLVYSNGDISVTKSGTYTNNTSIENPDLSLFSDKT